MINREKITLRELTAKDLDVLLRWRNNPDINKYLANRVKTKPEAETWFNHITGSPLNLLKVIIYNGQLIGYCMVESVDAQNRRCEVGIIIGDLQFLGKGIGKIIVTELLKYCFEKLKLHRVLAVIAKGNERSVRLFKSMGFSYEGALREANQINGQFVDLLCYSILEQEYKPV
jgi:RimJ/RimL family protein N-acetyltransferase